MNIREAAAVLIPLIIVVTIIVVYNIILPLKSLAVPH